MSSSSATGPAQPFVNAALASRLQDFQIGPQDVPLTFSMRLARECNWDAVHADRVFTEYRRFLYLMAVSMEELTPSEAVDAVWHLHMTYMRSYWEDLCGDVLRGQKFHHTPTQGGVAEGERFRESYDTTLRLYQSVGESASGTSSDFGDRFLCGGSVCMLPFG